MRNALRNHRPRTGEASHVLPHRWERRHSDAEFIINDDEVHCLQEIALNEAPEDIACLLLRKLARARLYHRYRMPLDVAALNCAVEFSIGGGEPQLRRLVHPRAVRLESDLDIASALGAGLIGMRAGQQIDWPDEQGIWRTVKLLSVAYRAAQPESPRRDPRGR